MMDKYVDYKVDATQLVNSNSLVIIFEEYDDFQSIYIRLCKINHVGEKESLESRGSLHGLDAEKYIDYRIKA